MQALSWSCRTFKHVYSSTKHSSERKEAYFSCKQYVLFFVFFFFKSSVKGPPVSFEETTSKLNDSSSSKQQTLEISVLSSEKISAELMLALHCCLNGIFNNSNQDTSDLFQTKFPDSKIAKSFQMESNKIESSITDGLGLLMEHFNQPPLARCVF